ncbi:MAG: hypothetical protein FGM18_02710 [Burkholderiaceae bacterium]|nr:hypothetical protein [Burkholderiaceae bacterium]
MLGRVVIIAALVGIGLWLLRRALSKRGNHNASESASGTSQTRLIECAHCGARLPATDAVWKEGQPFCSMTHRHLGPRG